MAGRGIAITAAALGFAGIILAAVGAHVVEGEQAMTANLWETAQQVHLFHAAALFGIAALAHRLPSQLVCWSAGLLATGTVVFSGSLYLRSAAIDLLPSFLTPLGGWLLLAGWALLLMILVRKNPI
jgi:uncharacterized membrane protein YgdD (TMEM256/DUF423 family)